MDVNDTKASTLGDDFSHEENKVLRVFFHITKYLNGVMAWVAGIALLSMIALIVFNAIKRLFSDPFSGTVEVVGWLAAITATFSLGYAQLHKAHVYIDLLFEKFPAMLQKIVYTIMVAGSIIFFTLVVLYLFQYGLTMKQNGTLSETLQLLFYPFILLCSFGFVGLVLSLIKDLIDCWR